MNIWDIQRGLLEAGRTLAQKWERKIKAHSENELLNLEEINKLNRLRIRRFERPVIEYIARKYNRPSNLVGVEIGVYRGDNAAYILLTLDMKKLFLIDPYLEYKEYKNNPGWEGRVQTDFNNFLEIATSKLKPYQEKVEFIKKKSEDAAPDVPDGLDFVYIDGNHEYDFVKRDIDLYYPKLKEGGVLGGDNLEMSGVSRAVIEFVANHSLNIHGVKWAQAYEWLVVKK